MDVIQPLLLGGKARCLDGVFLVAAAALALVMGQLGVGRPHDAIALVPHPEAEVHIVEGHGKLLIQPLHLIPHAGPDQQAGTRDGGEVLHGSGAEQIAAALDARDRIQYGDKLGRIWIEETDVDCDLYWGDSEGQFGRGAGCRAESDCVLPGENGTVFIGGHTGSYFSDLGSTELGAIIHLETDWGDFTYKVTDMQVIQETDVDKVRWGTEEPSCILYTCYPFGILTHTPQRYAVYADPVNADEYGVIPAETTTAE